MIELRRDWLYNINSMQREMDRLLNYLGSSKPPMVRFGPRVWEPAMDVYETENEVVVVVELAGVKEDQISVIAERNTLLIRGERKDTSTQGHKSYHQIEIHVGPFQRGIQLPTAVDPAKAKASCEDGLLRITLPKIAHTLQMQVVKIV